MEYMDVLHGFFHTPGINSYGYSASMTAVFMLGIIFPERFGAADPSDLAIFGFAEAIWLKCLKWK